MSDKTEDFLSFEKALRELKMRSEELKKLVSEGEIRAFRDGDSMKFRKEDITALTAKASGDSNLSFADSLEDDTGMVTEQISDEDTLLAEEDVAPAAIPSKRPSPSGRGRSVAVAAEPGKEPGWVTAAAILGTLVMIWGCLIGYSVAKERSPQENFFTSAFAPKAPK
ncbi:MAG TPA: hypothetical protein VFD82_19635 [Planctomycetota bacterium]|nr:hypothetical protein [Planctomycetota bacterium]